jgi:3',5'-cyclic AMP phosphodiesterase CpdA
MMRFTILSDLHLDRKAAPTSWSLMRKAFHSALEHKADHVVIAGDVFDSPAAMQNDASELKAELRKLGLWDPARLSIVPGNHDVFQFSHRSPWHIHPWGARGAYEAFCRWSAELVPAESRLRWDDPYPYVKTIRNVVLCGIDSTARTAGDSTKGFFHKGDEHRIRERLADRSAPVVLAVHHPVEQNSDRDRIKWGFDRDDFQRLRKLADDLGIVAVVCGHLHYSGGAPREWNIGADTAVYMLGSTGGLGSRPEIGLLTLGRARAWERVRLDDLN